MNRIISALLVVAALAVPATAFAEDVRYLVVTSVRVGDRNSVHSNPLHIRGETATPEVAPPVRYDGSNPEVFAECRRMAILAMSKPGKWWLDITFARYSNSSEIRECALVRAPAQ